MGYDWADKRDVCYRLYVQERKSLEEVVDYFRTKLDFVPSKRTFQTQFKRWGFPTKLDYSHRDENVVARVRQMWEKNVMQKDMLQILQAEGFNVTESGLMRLRFKHGMQLKSSNAVRNAVPQPNRTEAGPSISAQALAQELIPETGDKRKERQDELRVDSEAKWRSKKRRRHTKEWNGLPADPPGPPRYPSETTIGEAQKFLDLNDVTYRDVREQFKTICAQRGIVKKSICGPEAWDAAKLALVQDHAYLRHLFSSSEPTMLAPLELSLDILCMDVTKHMRMQSKNMTLTEAKNTLGLNPLESRVLKRKLIDILVANNFINTYESENWNGLKDEWLEGTVIKDRLPTQEGPERERFQKAIQLLCRDTLKRWREANRLAKKRDEGGEQAVNHEDHNILKLAEPMPASQPSQQPRKKSSLRAVRPVPQPVPEMVNGIQIDPSLLEAASSQVTGHSEISEAYPAPITIDAGSEPPLAVYFRKSSSTTDMAVPPLWLGALSRRNLADLRCAALGFPGGEHFGITKIEGVSMGPSGPEMLYQIDQDDELQGVLLHNEGRKASFVVHLVRTSLS